MNSANNLNAVLFASRVDFGVRLPRKRLTLIECFNSFVRSSDLRTMFFASLHLSVLGKGMGVELNLTGSKSSCEKDGSSPRSVAS